MSNRAVQIDFLAAGLGVPGAKIYTYEAGTLTPKLTWGDADKAVAATNPLIADSYGRVTAFGDGAYKFVITDANDVPVGVPLDGLKYRFDNFKVRTVIADTTADTDDDVIIGSTGAGNITITCADAATMVRPLKIKKSGAANTLTVDAYGSQTIDGQPTYVLSDDKAVVELISDGANLRATTPTVSTVGGFPASQTPAPNTIPASGASSRLAFGWNPSSRGCLVYNNTNGASNIQTWAAEAYDTDNIHDPVTNTSRLTVPAGVTRVQLFAQAAFLVTAAATKGALILKNGSSSYVGKGMISLHNALGNGITNDVYPLATAEIAVSAGDYFELQGTAALTPDAVGDSCWFAMKIIE